MDNASPSSLERDLMQQQTQQRAMDEQKKTASTKPPRGSLQANCDFALLRDLGEPMTNARTPPPPLKTPQQMHGGSIGALERTSSIRSNDSSASSPNMNSSIYRLKKSNSTASAGRMSVRSHVSVNAIGAIPYGSLELVTHSEDVEAGSTPTETSPMSSDMGAATTAKPRPSCVDKGDIFLILDLPEKFTLVHDTLVATAESNKILGVRDVPPGSHFLWVAGPGAMSRCGYWYVTGGHGEIRVKQWDRYNETLGEAASKFEARDKRENIKSIYPKLIPHGYKGEESKASEPREPPQNPTVTRTPSMPVPDFLMDDNTIWSFSTSAISEQYLANVTGNDKTREWLVDTTDAAKGERQFPETVGVLKTATSTELNFSFAPQDLEELRILQNSPMTTSEASPADRTTRVLELLQRKNIDEDFLAAELQFTFVTGTHLGNYSCIEQWWHLVLRIILRSYQLALVRPVLCRRLLQTIHAQMVHGDTNFAHQKTNGTAGLEDDTHSNSMLELMPANKPRLREALTVYKRRLNDLLLGLGDKITQEQGAVGNAFADLEAWFWKYGWDLRSDYVPESGGMQMDGNDSDGDYAPVVVDLDESGREVGLVSFN